MVYITGDIHGNPERILSFWERVDLSPSDTLIILGDVGLNYYGNRRDRLAKLLLSEVSATIFCIHGNHEMRPHTVEGYKTKLWNGGTVWYEEEFPNLLFARDGDIFTIEKNKYLVLGGAYSVDKYYRIQRGFGWWHDEQPDEETKQRTKAKIESETVDIVISHTCPFRYIPTEMFLPMLDQSTVDQSTEKWLGEIESRINYRAWFCGHWHTNKRVDKIHFLFDSWEAIVAYK